MKIYFAGPLFTEAEREWNVRAAHLITIAGHEVFLPQEHEPRDATAHDIFDVDVAGIDWADVVVAVMDGPDPDSGTCWEVGYAFKKKPILLVRTDFRGGTEGSGFPPFNLMMAESAHRTFPSINKLVDFLNAVSFPRPIPEVV